MPRLAIPALLAAALIGRLWVERSVTADLQAQRLLPLKLDLRVRDQMGQEGFAAVLGGMRAVVASYYELEAFTEFSKVPSNWPKVDQNYAVCTSLQPLDPHYWDTHAWMLASNLAEDYGTEGLAPKGAEPEMRAEYRKRGLAVLMKGLSFNPDSLLLNRAVADFHAFANPVINPTPNYALAAEYYLRASKCERALPWMLRFHALYLSRVKGREREGYDMLRAQYAASEKNRYPTAITRMKELEELLNIPYPRRIPEVSKKFKQTEFKLESPSMPKR